LTSVVDDKVGFAEVLELFRGRSDKHVVLWAQEDELRCIAVVLNGNVAYHEQSVVSPGGNDSDLDPVLGVPTGETVKHVNVFSGVQVVDSSFTVDLESVLAGR
jgi:hypothetical protein